MRSSGHKDDLVQSMGTSSASSEPYGAATKQGPAVEMGIPATGYPQQGPPPYQGMQQDPPPYQGMQQGFGHPGYQGQPAPDYQAQPAYQQGYQGQPVQHLNPNGIQPLPGLKMKGPRSFPKPGQILTGYEIDYPSPGCCKCDGLNTMGVVSVGLLVLFLPVIACLPCCMEECFEKYQRPVYDYPGQQHNAPVGMPPQGYR